MNKSNNKKYTPTKKEQKLAIFITIFAIMVLGGITYTFFSSVVSNTNNEKIQTSTATMSLKFDDGDNGISGTLNLGQSITKQFTLENTGTVDAYAKINWYNLVNTYTSDSLTWTLEQSTSENGTYTGLGSGKVPTSSTQTTKTLKNGILVPTNTTYYYKLTITLNNLDVEQNSDINASFYSYFSLEAGSLSGAEQLMQLVSNANPNSTDVITGEVPSGANCTNTLAYDGTTDNNLRYVGANPCNYVTFNGETAGWRIVGIMNNVDDGTGNKETRIKLIRHDALGNYSWDSSSSNVNYGNGVNDWTQADLKNELNGDYLNTSLNANTNWYNGQNNAQTGVFDYTKRLNAAAQNLIGDAKWHLGGFTYGANGEDMIAATMYTKERGTTVWGSTSGQTCEDAACPRATSWTGKVALIYPSDYGFATTGGTTTNRSSCIGTISTGVWYGYSDCYLNNWISYQWALSPTLYSPYDSFFVHGYYVNYSGTSYAYPVYPAVYLQSGVTISGGNGSPENPYVIG